MKGFRKINIKKQVKIISLFFSENNQISIPYEIEGEENQITFWYHIITSQYYSYFMTLSTLFLNKQVNILGINGASFTKAIFPSNFL